MKIGDKAPDFSLPATDGRTYSLKDFSGAKALVVVFSCNHCPYVVAYEKRMIALASDYAGKGVRLAAINSNDAARYPDDSFENMASRAKERGFNFPYLRDETQTVAKAYAATHTPHLFVFGPDRRLAYTGKIDDNWEKPEAVTRRYLREALDDIIAARPVANPETHAIGCTIKWRQ